MLSAVVIPPPLLIIRRQRWLQPIPHQEPMRSRLSRTRLARADPVLPINFGREGSTPWSFWAKNISFLGLRNRALDIAPLVTLGVIACLAAPGNADDPGMHENAMASLATAVDRATRRRLAAPGEAADRLSKNVAFLHLSPQACTRQPVRLQISPKVLRKKRRSSSSRCAFLSGNVS